MGKEIKIREEYRRDGLFINFNANGLLISLFRKVFPHSIINIGYPSICPGEYLRCKEILEFNKQAFYYDDNTELCLSGHARKEDLDIIKTLLGIFQNTSAAIWIPVSDGFIKKKFGSKKNVDSIRTEIIELLKYWKNESGNIPIDISLADCFANETKLEKRIVVWANDFIENGARNIIISDSLGKAEEKDIKRVFGKFKEQGSRVQLEFHAHNDNGEALNNIRTAIDEYDEIYIISTAIFSSSERFSLVDSREVYELLEKKYNKEIFKIFEKYYEQVIKPPSDTNVIITGNQYDLLGTERDCKLGVTSDKKAIEKIIERGVSTEELAYLKDHFFYNSQNTKKIFIEKKDIINFFKEKKETIKDYVKLVTPKELPENPDEFFDALFEKVKKQGELNILFLGGGLGLYQLLFIPYLLKRKNNEINILTVDNDYHNLLYSKIIFSEFVKSKGNIKDFFNKLRENPQNERQNGILDLESHEIGNISFKYKLANLNHPNLDFLEESYEIVTLIAILHKLNNPLALINKIKKHKNLQIITSYVLGDWQLFQTMFDDYKLYSDVFEDDKYKFWKSFWKGITKDIVPNLDWNFEQMVKEAFTKNYNFIAETGILAGAEFTVTKEILESWLTIRTLFNHFPRNYRDSLVNKINKMGSISTNFVHKARLIAYRYDDRESVNNCEVSINQLENLERNNIRQSFEIPLYFGNYLIRLKKTLGMIQSETFYIVLLPYIQSYDNRWVSELGAIYINGSNEKDSDIRKSRLDHFMLMSLPTFNPTEIKYKNITDMFFRDLIKDFSHQFFIKIIFINGENNELNINIDKTINYFPMFIFHISIQKKDELNKKIQEIIDKLYKLAPTKYMELMDIFEQNFGIYINDGLNLLKNYINNYSDEDIKKKVKRLFEEINAITLNCDFKNVPKFYADKLEIYLKDGYLKSLTVMAILSNHKYMYGIPIRRYIKNESLGVLISWFYVNFENEDKAKHYEKVLINKFYLGLKSISNNIAVWDNNRLILRESIKSAIAAIMSRNGSHNIGSHILAAVSNKYNELPDDQILFEYIQQRLDFVAQVPTGIPKWSQPTWFVKDIMRRFYEQRHLLRYIARSEGLTAYEFQNEKQANKDSGKLLIKIKTACKDEFIIDEKSIQGKISSDVQLAIPGGIIGQHAFYTILENFIRNSAKHGWSHSQNGNLEITIEFLDNSDKNFVLFRIWDNKSKIKKHEIDNDKPNEKVYTHELMNEKIGTSFIDMSDGRLKPEDWGIAEMKISTGFLNMKAPEIIGSDKPSDLILNDDLEEGLIRAFARDEEGGSIIYDKQLFEFKEYHLGYEFKIPKPKELILIGFENDSTLNSELKGYRQKDEISYDYEFCLVKNDPSNSLIKLFTDSSPDEIEKEIEKYPNRLFVLGEIENIAKNDFLRKRVCVISESEFNALLENGATLDDFKLFLYEKWLNHIFKERGLFPARILINLSGTHQGNDEICREIIRRFGDKLIELEKTDDQKGLRSQIKKLLDIDSKILFRGADHFVDHIKTSTLKVKENIRLIAKNYFDITKSLLIKYEEEIETLPIAYKGNNIYCEEFKVNNSNLIKNNILITEDGITENNKVAISYNRHSLLEYIEDNGYSEAISGAQIYFSILSNFALLSPYLQNKTINLLIENAFLNYLIIDERVAQYVSDNNLKIKFNLMNIEVPFVLSKEKGKNENSKLINLIANISSNQDDLNISKIAENRYDIAIIHQGVLQKLVDQFGYDSTSDIISMLKKNIPFVYVTSGRGRPAGLPDNAKFFAFSNIETYLLKKYPEKVLLTLILFKIL